MRKRKIWIVIILVLMILGIPFAINEMYKVNSGYITVWGGSDVLSFYGAFLGAAGTIILGVVAWKQNERLLKLEEHTYLAANAGASLLADLNVTNTIQTACNFNIHTEPVVITKSVTEVNDPRQYHSIEFMCRLSPMDRTRHTAFVRVNSAQMIIISQQNELTSDLTGKCLGEEYSRVAISEETDTFRMTFVMSEEEKQKFVKGLEDHYSRLVVCMNLSLVSDKYVETILECRTLFDVSTYEDNSEKQTMIRPDSQEPPRCFWCGASVLNKEDIRIKEIKRVPSA